MKYIENGTCGQVSVYTKHIRLSTCGSYPLCCCWSLTFFINSRDYRHTHNTRHFSCVLFDLKGDLALLFSFSKQLLCRPLFYSHSSCQKSFRHQQNIQKHFSPVFFFITKRKKILGPLTVVFKWKRMGEDAPPLVFRWRREISGQRKPTWGDCDETSKVQKREIQSRKEFFCTSK
jgi:hypothetical protein